MTAHVKGSFVDLMGVRFHYEALDKHSSILTQTNKNWKKRKFDSNNKKPGQKKFEEVS